jgi:clan AA aspartic protease (TIGR02281 family)
MGMTGSPEYSRRAMLLGTSALIGVAAFETDTLLRAPKACKQLAQIRNEIGSNPYATATLNGWKLIPVWLDSGAYHTTISRQTAEEIGYKNFVFDSDVMTGKGPLKQAFITLNSLAVGDARATNIRIHVSGYDAGRLECIGMDFFSLFKIDMRPGVFTISENCS